MSEEVPDRELPAEQSRGAALGAAVGLLRTETAVEAVLPVFTGKTVQFRAQPMYSREQ